MTIRTRPSQNGIEIAPGETLLILNQEQVELIAALLCMVKLGHRPYQNAALELSEMLDELNGNVDFGLECLASVNPKFNILDPDTLDIVASYDDDDIIEIVV